MDQLKTWFKSLQPQERMLVSSAGVIIAIAVLYLAIFGPLATALSTRQDRVDRKQQDLVWMRGMSNAVRTLAASHPGGMANESLVVVVNRTAQQASMTSALTNQAPSGDNSIRVRVEGGNFDSLVNWIALLEQQYGIQVETASIDRTDKIGIVNATLLLNRGK